MLLSCYVIMPTLGGRPSDCEIQGQSTTLTYSTISLFNFTEIYTTIVYLYYIYYTVLYLLQNYYYFYFFGLPPILIKSSPTQ